MESEKGIRAALKNSRKVKDLHPVKREIDEIFATDRMEAVDVDVKERKEGCC